MEFMCAAAAAPDSTSTPGGRRSRSDVDVHAGVPSSAFPPAAGMKEAGDAGRGGDGGEAAGDDAPDVGPPRPQKRAAAGDGDGEDAPDVGPPRPPPGADGDADQDDDQDGGPDVGPSLPPPKRKRVLEHESVYLTALPCAEMYEKSFMHRDTITHVVRASPGAQLRRLLLPCVAGRAHGTARPGGGMLTPSLWCVRSPAARGCPPHLPPQVATPRTEFFVTASADGHVKFWKKNGCTRCCSCCRRLEICVHCFY